MGREQWRRHRASRPCRLPSAGRGRAGGRPSAGAGHPAGLNLGAARAAQPNSGAGRLAQSWTRLIRAHRRPTHQLGARHRKWTAPDKRRALVGGRARQRWPACQLAPVNLLAGRPATCVRPRRTLGGGRAGGECLAVVAHEDREFVRPLVPGTSLSSSPFAAGRHKFAWPTQQPSWYHFWWSFFARVATKCQTRRPNEWPPTTTS